MLESRRRPHQLMRRRRRTSRSRFELGIIVLVDSARGARLCSRGIIASFGVSRGARLQHVCNLEALQGQPLCANMIAALQLDLCLFFAIEKASFAPFARRALEHTRVHLDIPGVPLGATLCTNVHRCMCVAPCICILQFRSGLNRCACVACSGSCRFACVACSGIHSFVCVCVACSGNNRFARVTDVS